ncbi:MAG: ATP-binding protein [Bacteroidota bacterium]
MEKEVRPVYEGYWESYFKGDKHLFASFLDPQFELIGTSESEICHGKAKMLAYFDLWSKDIVGKAEFRHRKIQCKPVNDLILFTEMADVYILIETDWRFYSRLRLSTFLRNTKTGWKVVQQHGSLPDARPQEGETVSFENLTKENLELREAVKRRTIELEQKSRELEIETALERVRAIAMGMREPADMLEVCKTISLQLQSLGVKEIRNVQTAIFYESRGTYMNYEFYSRHKKTIVTETTYTNHKVHKAFATKMLKGKGEVFITHIKGKKVKDWIAYQKTTNVFIDRFLGKASSLNYYWHSLGPVALGISTYVPLSKEDLILFKRFLNVFELAYTRYLDIEQAHAQAREAQIEASLEKVRAQALGMRKPEDLPDVCEVLFRELQTLGFSELRNAMVNIHNDEKETFVNYDYSDVIGKSITPLFYSIHPVIEKQIKQIRSARDAFSETVFKGKELQKWKEFRRQRDEKDDPRIKNIAALHYYFYSIGTGSIGISTFSSIGEGKLEVLKRFRIVFDFAYRRYMDVAQAEEQAREARIEAALERVRAQAMSMRKSDELLNVCESVFKQLQALGFSNDILRNSQIVINQDGKGLYHGYQYSDYVGAEFADVPYNLHPVITFLRDKLRESSEAFVDIAITGKLLDDWKNFVNNFPQKHDDKLNAASELHYYFYSVGIGALGISTFKSITEQQLGILKRFRNVFDLSYKRYTDIALAEAQAREAQINLAVERVRARALSMYKSEEILELVFKLKQEMMDLGIPNVVAATIHLKEKDGNYTMWDLTAMEYTEGKLHQPMVVHYRLEEVDPNLFIKRMWENTDPYFLVVQDEEDFKHTIQFLRDHDRTKEADESEAYLNNAGIKYAYHPTIPLNNGRMCIDLLEPPSDEIEMILTKMGAAFDLAYRRFLDLQKAEAQAREAQIETALERVRSRSMAMQKSEELKEVIKIVYQQLTHLKIKLDHSGFVVDYTPGGDWHFWIADEQDIPSKITHPYFESVWANQFNEAKEKGADLFATHLTFEEKNRFYNELLSYVPGLPEASKEFYLSCPGLAASTVLLDNVGLYIENFSGTPYTDEENNILMRFGKVFQQTYTRFLDLQKAEAQAREAKIEASLEKVRSRTMAMHSSNELQEAAILLFQQIRELGVNTGSCGYVIWGKEKKDSTVWMSSAEGDIQAPFEMPHTKSKIYQDIYSARDSGKDFFAKEVNGMELKNHFDYLTTVPGIGEKIKQLRKARYTFPETIVYNSAFFKQGYLSFHTHKHSPEAHDIFKRFANVFEQTYTRFLDLQKAEAQAREAQTEAALERIRARAMAMHTSDELMDVAGILREQMGLLGQPELETSVINLFEENSDHVLSWHAFRSPELSSGNIITGAASFPWDSSAISREMMEAYRSGVQEHTMEADGAKAMELFQVLVQAAPEIAQYAGDNPPERVCYHLTYFSGGALLMVSYQPPSEEAKSLQRRAASVFDMAYRRYRDLKKAEGQTREATIEASLEKVRGKAMAMHTSSDISETMGVVFSELPKLGIGSLRCGVALFSKDSRRVIFYAAANALESDSLTLIGTGVMSGHPEFENQYECWLKQEHYFVTLSDEALRSYYEALAARLSAPYTPREHREQTEHGYYFPFSTGNFYAWSEKPYSESEIDILQRFKAIIDLTFRRYLDLKQAEVQTREAQIETSLERVRSRTLAMQKSDELAETAAVLFRQLITLGIEPNRLYIAIMKDESGNAEFWITDEDGSKVSTGFSANLRGNGSFQKMLAGWQEGTKSITIDMQGKELQEYFQHLSSLSVPFKGGLSQTRRVQNIAYFSRGFIGMASPDTQPEETTTLLERFATVFNLTLTRFNDLKLAEAQAHQAHLDLIQLQTEKKRAEEALTELRATQEQLLQQEKLASLGQLTAGIAHEIKNPLNFVNNFSSVSVELVDEAMEEIKKLPGSSGDVQQLLDDVKKNLSKIIEHGTRADGIVKSMLQHSRGGSGKKEPVDLNALVKEYVNLAFHGMRAGKSPINVDIVLELEQSINKVPVIAEDFSRVIINLCQNAFDAMREKFNPREKKAGSYLPKLTVRTRREADKIIVEVGDNGPGIPDAIKDKILQPFFTTKKGTQGTGLGLSITHDIVKAHGGEMSIETNSSGGATFAVSLQG